MTVLIDLSITSDRVIKVGWSKETMYLDTLIFMIRIVTHAKGNPESVLS